ncbi:class I SAM-dependent methyltransferase [Bradyrhizobium cenepequi]|uniref:class I SAM-dependent methyltransferase n=1 Tax=Bradyrhizobium cenepequi TaxID=2821403 RepID=UPI001CE31C34|nr:class I SAM-dependent methyltransferase [Bradyrhizobium cenepequi]MCA6108959.1 class I SAM-dependent methyltransferase [Bradyrhizobium cenepequi]
MTQHKPCPWWVGYLIASPIRKLWHDPALILESYIREGMTVLEPGPGMGFFTLEIAKLVGPSGRVVAVDVEPRMIEGLKRRARKAGLLDRIDARVVSATSMQLADLDASADFVFAFAVVHELPSAASFFSEAARAMKSGADLLLAEPVGHVSEAEFAEQIGAAADDGLKALSRPSINHCIAALLRKA